MTVLGRSPLIALIAFTIAVPALAGCGKSAGLIPKSDATVLSQKLDAIGQLLDSGDCAQLPNAISDAQQQALALPTSVDARLRRRINEGLTRLETQAPRDCAAGKTTTTATTTTATTTTATTTTVPTTTTDVPTTTTSTVTTPTTPTVTTLTTPTVTTPTTTAPSGGAPSGGSPGNGGASPDSGGATP
jgi:hypothetical protein